MADVTSQGVLSAVARKSVAAAAAGVVVEDVVTSYNNSGVQSHTVNLPATINSGDLLIVIFWQGSVGGTVTFDGGDGFTQFSTTGVANGYGEGELWYVIADGTEGASTSVTTSGFTNFSATVVRLSGHNATWEDVTTTVTSGATNSQTFPAITSVTDDCLILRMASLYGTSAEPTQPTGYTNAGYVSASNPNTLVTYKTQDTAGTEASQVFAGSFYTGYAYYSLAIRPASQGLVPTHLSSLPPTSTARSSRSMDISSATEGALLFAAVTCRSVQPTLAVPAGWTLLTSFDNGSSSNRPYTSIYYKTAGASETTVVFNFSPSEYTTAVAIEIIGANTSTFDTASNAISDVLGMVTVPTGGIVIGVHGKGSDSDTSASTFNNGSYAILSDQFGTKRSGTAVAWADLGSGDTNGTDTVSGAGTTTSTGTIHIAIQPA